MSCRNNLFAGKLQSDMLWRRDFYSCSAIILITIWLFWWATFRSVIKHSSNRWTILPHQLKKSHNYYPWKCELKEPDKPSIRRNIYLKQIISFSPWSVYSYHTLFNCQRMFLISPEIEYLIIRFFYLKKMERKKPDKMKDEYNDFDV